jgi:hypothetical protein
MQEQHTSEKLTFSIDEGKTESFMEQRNLKMVEHMDKEAIERTFLTGDDGLLIGQIPGHFRFVLVTPKGL